MIDELLKRNTFIKMDRRGLPLLIYDPYWEYLLSFYDSYIGLREEYDLFSKELDKYETIENFEEACSNYIAGMRKQIKESPLVMELLSNTIDKTNEMDFFRNKINTSQAKYDNYYSLDLKTAHMQFLEKLNAFNGPFQETSKRICEDDFIRSQKRLNDAMYPPPLTYKLTLFGFGVLYDTYNCEDELCSKLRETELVGMLGDELLYNVPDERVGEFEKYLGERNILGYDFHVRRFNIKKSDFKIKYNSGAVSYHTLRTKIMDDGKEKYCLIDNPYLTWMLKLQKGLPVTDYDKFRMWRGRIAKLDGELELLSPDVDLEALKETEKS